MANFCIHASKGPVIIMSQLKSIYNSPFKDSHSHPIQTCFPMIASNVHEIWHATKFQEKMDAFFSAYLDVDVVRTPT